MIKKITAHDTLPIRRTAMYPNQTLEYVKLEDDDQALHLGAFHEETLVSVLSIFPGTPKRIRKFATLPSYQNKGYGTQLLRAALSQLKEPVILHAREEKCTFYTKFGFVETEQRYEARGFIYCVMERKGKIHQIDNNPFPYSFDNKRYQTYNYYTYKTYGRKAFKVGLDAGFTCPNRDGTCGSGGCNFCSARGSGDMILKDPNLEAQIVHSERILRAKWPDAACIAYFQAYSNTHDSLEALKKLYTPFFFDDRFVGLDIATRSDCLDEAKIKFFADHAHYKDLTIEIGLQSIHPETARWMNRGHDLDSVTNAVRALKKAGIRTCVHIINGFPNESKAMMLETANYLAWLHPDMVKIHMLHILKGTKLGHEYTRNPFPLLSQSEYVSLVGEQIARLPEDIVVARVTGDAMTDDLLAPEWTRRKVAVTNDIDTFLVQHSLWQGKHYNPKRYCPQEKE